MWRDSCAFCLAIFQFIVLSSVTFGELDPFGPQRFNCPKSYTFTNSRLQGGLQAGDFTRMGPPDDTETCVQRCCDQRACDLVAWIGDHCYAVSCASRELCKPVSLPSYHKGMRLLYIAAREDADDEVEPNRREISESTSSASGQEDVQIGKTRGEIIKSRASTTDPFPAEIPKQKSNVQVKRIIRSLEKMEDEEDSDLEKVKSKKLSRDKRRKLSDNTFFERNSEKMNYQMDDDEASGEPGDWEGGQLSESGAAEDEEADDDILQGRARGVSAVKRTETAVAVTPENLSELKDTAGRLRFGSLEDTSEESENSSGDDQLGESDFAESGSSETSAADFGYSDDVSGESTRGSGNTERYNKTIMREVERNLHKVWRYAASKTLDMVAKGPKGKEEEEKLQKIYDLVIKHESGSSREEDGRQHVKESVSGEASGLDLESTDFSDESADSSATRYDLGSALLGEENSEREDTRIEMSGSSGDGSEPSDGSELSGSSGEGVSGSGVINKELMNEVEQNLHKVWRYAAPKKDLDMVAKGPKGKEEEDKLKKIYNIVSKHQAGSAFMEFEQKKAKEAQKDAANRTKQRKIRKSRVKFTKKGKHQSEAVLSQLQKTKKVKFDKHLRQMRPWGMGTGKSYGKFKGEMEGKSENQVGHTNWKTETTKLVGKGKDMKLLILGEEMNEMAPASEESGELKANEVKNVNAKADKQETSKVTSPKGMKDEKTKFDRTKSEEHAKPKDEKAKFNRTKTAGYRKPKDDKAKFNRTKSEGHRKQKESSDEEIILDKTQQEVGRKLEQLILSRVAQLETEKFAGKQKGKYHYSHWKDRKEKEEDKVSSSAPDHKGSLESYPMKDRLLTALEKLRFIGGPSTVYNASRFVYLKQCGLYVEEYNVSKTRASWNNDLFSPYSYLYEMPKGYHKCNSSVWMNRTDLRGDVFLSFRVMSLKGSTMVNNGKICEQYCCHEPRCQAWTLRFQQADTANCPKGTYCCWLKSAIPVPIRDSEHCTSGIVRRESTKHPVSGMRSAVPLGGLGTGSFELRADGTIHEWTIENQSPGGSAKLNKGALNLAVFGVRVADRNNSDAALLRIHAPRGYPGVESLSYSGIYPVSRLTPGGSITKHVDMSLYAFPSFHVREPYKSAVPAVAFTLGLRNKHDKPLDISFLFNLPLGQQEDTIRVGDNFGEVVYTRLIKPADCAHACSKMPKCMSWTTNGPTSCLLKDKMPLHAWATGIVSGLKGDWVEKDSMLTNTRPGFFPQSGSTTLHVVDEDGRTGYFAVADDFNDIWQNFSRSGEIGDLNRLNKTGIHGSATVKTTLSPGESKSVTIIMSWYFPHRDLAKIHVGNLYSALFKSSEDAAQHMRNDLEQSVIDIHSWHRPIVGTETIRKEPINDKARRFPERPEGDDIHELPDWLRDMLVNSMSFWRSGFWTEDGKWRQWEALDCNDIDTIQNDMQRIIPYTLYFPELVRDLLLSWADNQYSSGMLQEALTTGCLGPTGKLDYAGGRVMADTTTMFVVGLYHYYQWTGDQATLDRLWPAAKRAMDWVMVDSTRGTGLPFRKVSTYDIVALDKYDHDSYNSFVYLLSLRVAQELGTIKNDTKFMANVKQAFAHAQKRMDLELWDEKREYYHAWWDMEYGSPDWIMSDSLYGQVWAYTLGLGDLVPRRKLKAHLLNEVQRNDSPFGLKVLNTGLTEMTPEDTSIILSRHIPGCKSLENITKHNSVWMGADADWASLMLHLDTDPIVALNRAKKSLDHWRSTLNDQWNIHGLVSSNGYGLDGLPWATSHYTFHLVLWHIPLALSGQQFYAPNASLTFWPKLPIPFSLPFFTPKATGTIQGAYVKGDESEEEELFTFTVTSGSLVLKELAVSGSTYGKGEISFKQGDSVSWSRPKQDVKNILQQL